MTFYVLIFVAGFILLARSSSFLVRSLTVLARMFSISEYAIAFIFMSMATSVPELFVGISSALKSVSQFSLGNVLGASLINVTLVIGVVVFLGKGLHIDSKISRRNFWLISIFSFLPLFLATDGLISRGDGLILLLMFIVYVWRLKKEEEYFSKTIEALPVEKTFTIFKQLSGFFIALLFLVSSSYVIVWSGKNLVSMTTLSMMSFGLIFVALGTTLPEIVFSIRARALGHDSMAIGNSLGSVAFNSTLIIGVVSLIDPISVVISLDLIVVVAALFASLLFFNFFVFSKSIISRKEGLILIFIYLAFLSFEFLKYFTDIF